MKKSVLVAIFAHPDDESFGPGGTLALYSKTHDVYVICSTLGQSGKNHHNGDIKNIAKIRCRELLNSAKILGVKKVFCLEYMDGSLSNNQYHKIADDIKKITDKLKPEILMTFEGKGVSGHIDHIAVTMIVNYIFEQIEYAKTLMYYCILEEESQGLRPYFIYVPEGFRKSEVDKIVDISTVNDLKIRALKKHRSQASDVNRVLKQREKLPKEEHFIIKTK